MVREEVDNKDILLIVLFYCRLSYHQRIVEMMPEAYAKLLPVSPQPNYKYASEEAGKFFYLIVILNND